MGAERKVYRILIGKTECKARICTPNCSREGVFEKARRERLDWIELANDGV